MRVTIINHEKEENEIGGREYLKPFRVLKYERQPSCIKILPHNP